MHPKRWQDVVLQQFGHAQAQSVVVLDPDQLMKDDILISQLQARDYDILNLTTEVSFRHEFEERYRSRWDNGEKTHIVVIVHSNDARQHLPYDLERKSRVIEIGLHQIFPRLNRIVLADLDRMYYADLFKAHSALVQENKDSAAEKETVRFILRSVFGIDPVALKDPERLVAMLIDKHYASHSIPEALRRYVVEEMMLPLPGDPEPIALFADSRIFYEWLAERWTEYVRAVLMGNEVRTINFADTRLRLSMDNLFTERLVEPCSVTTEEMDAVQRLSVEQRWIRSGLAWPDESVAQIFVRATSKPLAEGGVGYVVDVQTQLSHFEGLTTEGLGLREWLDEGYSWGRLVHDFTLLPKHDYEALQQHFVDVRHTLNKAFLTFLQETYPSISFYDDNKGPVALHRVNRHIQQTVDEGERLALIIFDGMAVDQWFLLRDYLLAQGKDNIQFRENRAYAIAPTITSVSRQTLLAGRMPGNFPETALLTTADEEQWRNYWVNQGRRRKRVAYLNVKMSGDFTQLRQAGDSNNEILAVVVNFIDDVMHNVSDLRVGKRIFYDTIISYLKNSATDAFFRLLLQYGYRVFITSDHGNLDAIGIGVDPPKTLAETYARRVCLFDQEPIARRFAAEHGLVTFKPLFLPDNLYPVYPSGEAMFGSRQSAGICHGGLSVEEMIVPFIEVLGT